MTTDNLPRVDWDAVCTCGHTFAQHRTPGSECIECMGGEGDGCSWPLTGAECRAELYEAYRTRSEITRERDELQRRMDAALEVVARRTDAVRALCEQVLGEPPDAGRSWMAREVLALLDGEDDQ